MSELSDRIKAASAFELDNHATDWAKGIHSESARLQPLLESLCDCAEALEDAGEHTASHLEDMEHYFDNKCCPTVGEVNQCAAADSQIRLAIGRLRETLARMRNDKAPQKLGDDFTWVKDDE